MQEEFGKVESQFSSRINNLYLSERTVLNEKIKQQNAEIKRLELKCTDYVKKIQQMEETNEALRQLPEEKEITFESSNNSGDFDFLSQELSCESSDEETSSNDRVSSSLFSASRFHARSWSKRSYSEIPYQVIS